MSDLFLAVDGGNSKTDVVLGDASGRILARGRGGGFRPQVTGVDAALDVLAGVVAEVLPAVQGRPVARMSAFLAGADLPAEVDALHTAISERGWATDVHVDNDTFALLHSGAPDGWGVAVVCGTGINCVGIGPDGTVVRYPALGPLSGDWGGGGDMGRLALWHAVRGEDGRGPSTALSQALAEYFGTASAADVGLRIHHGPETDAILRPLSRQVFALSDAGDAVARSIVDRQADEICAMGIAAIRRLGVADLPVAVVLGGGVLAAENPRLIGRVTDGFAAATKAELRLVTLPPVAGAAAHALGPDADAATRTLVLDAFTGELAPNPGW